MVKPDAPESIVLFASDVVAWVNAFPAIAADMLGSSMKDFFHFATWQNSGNRAFRTKTFISTPESAVIFENVRRHADWKNKPTTARLTVSGDAGVGKSRTVFEAIAALPEVAPLTIYTDDEDKALDLARAMANDQNLYAVLVADECLDATAFQLAKILQGVEYRVRLVTIDNALWSAWINPNCDSTVFQLQMLKRSSKQIFPTSTQIAAIATVTSPKATFALQSSCAITMI